MYCCNPLLRALLGTTLGLAGMIWLASPRAHAAPGGACLARSAKQVARLGAAAETALATGRKADAWRHVRDAVRAARRGGCTTHRSLGRAYLVLGIMEHRNGRYTRMYSAWQKGLGLDRTLTLDPRFTNPRLRQAFGRLKRKLVPAAVVRPRPRLRPQPPPAVPTAPRRTAAPPARPAIQPEPGSPPTPTPYGTRTGCSTDQDCKGSRVCDRGHCVYPRTYRAPSPSPTPTPATGAYAQPVVRHAPKPPLARRRSYGDRGCVELGLGIGLQYSETSARYEDDNDDNFTITSLHFDLNVYVGYFVANRFKLGFYFATPITKTTYPDIGYDEGSTVLQWEVDLIGAPGFAWPFSKTVFGFVDFLLGFGVVGGDNGTVNNDDLVMGLVGGETGIKFLIGRHSLLKLGLKPVYLFGKTSTSGGYYSSSETIKIGDFRVIVTMGFSAFW